MCARPYFGGGVRHFGREYPTRMSAPFLPGRPLPDPSTSQERTLYHAPRASGEMATMTREAGLWQWRQLQGDGADAYGSGGWNELQRWLAQG